MRRFHSPRPYALLLLLVACEAGDSQCLETRRVVAYAETTSAGISAESLMNTMAGEFDGVLSWQSGKDIVQVTPSVGTTAFKLSLIHEGGEVALIDREPHNLASGERLDCTDELVIAAVLELETADGGLLGRWDVEALHALGSGSLGVELRPFGPGNDGTFAASLLRPEEWDPDSAEVFMSNAFDTTGVSGTIILGATRTLRDDGKVMDAVDLVARVATWSIARP